MDKSHPTGCPLCNSRCNVSASPHILSPDRPKGMHCSRWGGKVAAEFNIIIQTSQFLYDNLGILQFEALSVIEKHTQPCSITAVESIL